MGKLELLINKEYDNIFAEANITEETKEYLKEKKKQTKQRKKEMEY